MADLRLDIVYIPTFNSKTLGIVDASTYPDDPPIVTAPTIEITVPGFDPVEIPFVPTGYNIFNSVSLGLSDIGDIQVLPDGLYHFTYSVTPSSWNYVDRSFMRVDKLQEKFDTAFMKLDMQECDQAIKKQAKVELNTISFYIQGSIAAANNCDELQATKLYVQADLMLDRFISANCGCTGINYPFVMY
jgi:hypothetical protein